MFFTQTYLLSHTRLTLIKETLEKVKATVNSKGDAPEVTGLDKVTIKVGEEFNPMKDVTITDDRDTIDQLKITVDKGNFDNTVAGTYTIKYTVEDRDGNITVAERIIIVEENENNSTNNSTNNKPNNDKDTSNNSNNVSNSDKDTSKDEINNSKNPSTSDKSNILTLSLIGMASIVGLLFVNRKKKKNK